MPAPAVLGRARELVLPTLRAAVDSLVENLRVPAAYQMGWVEADGSPIPNGGGKGIRPTLAIVSAEAVGADPAIAIDAAAAVELIHNFSLVHDDIVDDDEERRHRPTVWKLWGEGDAIIVGDAMHTLAFELLLAPADPSRGRVEAARRLARGTTAMIAGQNADMSFERRDDVSFDECLDMEANKTGALLAYSSAVGAVMAGADSTTIDALDGYGAAIGIAFQAVDDLLGIWGDPAATGKAVGNDLRERKRSMPVTAAIESGMGESEAIGEMYASADPLSDAQVDQLSDLIDRAGGRERTEAVAREHLTQALACLDSAELVEGPAQDLRDLAHFIVGRTY